MIPPPPRPTLFPYTTLFRSRRTAAHHAAAHRQGRAALAAPLPERLLRGHARGVLRSEEHTSELQSHSDLVCRLLLEKKKTYTMPQQLRRNNHTARSDAG